MKGVRGVSDVSQRFWTRGGEIECKFCGAGAGRNNGPTRAVLFVDFGKEIEAVSAGIRNNKVGSCGRELARGWIKSRR